MKPMTNATQRLTKPTSTATIGVVAALLALFVAAPSAFATSNNLSTTYQCQNHLTDTICNGPIMPPGTHASLPPEFGMCSGTYTDWGLGQSIVLYYPCGSPVAKIVTSPTTLCDEFPWAAFLIELITAGQGC